MSSAGMAAAGRVVVSGRFRANAMGGDGHSAPGVEAVWGHTGECSFWGLRGCGDGDVDVGGVRAGAASSGDSGRTRRVSAATWPMSRGGVGIQGRRCWLRRGQARRMVSCPGVFRRTQRAAAAATHHVGRRSVVVREPALAAEIGSLVQAWRRCWTRPGRRSTGRRARVFSGERGGRRRADGVKRVEGRRGQAPVGRSLWFGVMGSGGRCPERRERAAHPFAN